MRKQELIHLHGLLHEVSEQYEDWTGEDVDMGRYRSMNTRPTSIHKSKDDHREAVFALADAVVAELPEDAAEPRRIAAD